MATKKTNIRKKFLLIFTVILLLSFSLIGVLFSIAESQYIKYSAIAQLDTAADMLQSMKNIRLDELKTIPSVSNRMNVFRIRANLFPIDEKRNPVSGIYTSAESLEIMNALNDTDISCVLNRRVKTNNGIYYVSTHHMADTPLGKNVYWIAFADVTGLTFFANSVYLFLIFLFIVMFIIAIFIIYFLSNAITQPLDQLGSLVTNIGRGDFTPKDFQFKDIEFKNLNTALNKAAKQLRIYDNEQKAFFQNVSHELRTPLMSIKCYAEGISVGLMEPKKASETISQETDRLSEMVTDLLYISRVDNMTSEISKTKTDLISLMRTCAKHHKAIASSKQIHFSYDFSNSHIYLNCVSELIARAINNLISNAIRYASSKIILTCKKESDSIIIRVTDDGAGIDAESMPHLFERFFKGAGGNHGIGLSLVKSIAEQHDGNITAENSTKGGAVFTITLPIPKENE